MHADGEPSEIAGGLRSGYEYVKKWREALHALSAATASFEDMDTFCICELCRAKVDPADPNVVRAVEMIEVVVVGPTPERLRGLTVFFHREHYPSGSEDYELAA